MVSGIIEVRLIFEKELVGAAGTSEAASGQHWAEHRTVETQARIGTRRKSERQLNRRHVPACHCAGRRRRLLNNCCWSQRSLKYSRHSLCLIYSPVLTQQNKSVINNSARSVTSVTELCAQPNAPLWFRSENKTRCDNTITSRNKRLVRRQLVFALWIRQCQCRVTFRNLTFTNQWVKKQHTTTWRLSDRSVLRSGEKAVLQIS